LPGCGIRFVGSTKGGARVTCKHGCERWFADGAEDDDPAVDLPQLRGQVILRSWFILRHGHDGIAKAKYTSKSDILEHGCSKVQASELGGEPQGESWEGPARLRTYSIDSEQSTYGSR